MKFSHSTTTKASPQTIWAIWTDVENWANWDTELRSAQLEGSFQLGAKGLLVPKKGVKSAFEITEYVPNQSYAFTTKLPLAKLKVRRFLAETEPATKFVHEVSFSGLLGGLWSLILGGTFKDALPKVMENLRRLAEAEENQ